MASSYEKDTVTKIRKLEEILTKLYEFVDKEYEIPEDILFSYENIKTKCHQLFHIIEFGNENVKQTINIQSLLIIHSDLIELLEEFLSEDNVLDFPSNIQNEYYALVCDQETNKNVEVLNQHDQFWTNGKSNKVCGVNIKDEPVPITDIFSSDCKNVIQIPLNGKRNVAEQIKNIADTEKVKLEISEISTSSPKQYCKICKQQFRFQTSYNRHVTWHSITKPCLVKLLKINKKIINKHKPYRCNECDFQTAYVGNLNSHVKTVHLALKNYPCLVCKRRFSTNTVLRVHMRSHTKVKPYSCEECTFSFTSNSGLKQHIRSHHSGGPVKAKRKKTNSDDGILTNSYKIHNNCYKCMHCETSCDTRWNIYTHIRKNHTHKNFYKCDTCEYQTWCEAYLLSHKRKHNNDDRPFKCKLCNFAFKWKLDCERHENLKRCLKMSKKKVKCPHCDMRYTGNHGLIQHIKRKHADSEMYLCNFCGKKIFSYSAMRDHHKKKHPEKGKVKITVTKPKASDN